MYSNRQYLRAQDVFSLFPTSRGVHFDQDVISSRFDDRRHHVLHRRVHGEHQGERLVVRPVDLVQNCTETRQEAEMSVHAEI